MGKRFKRVGLIGKYGDPAVARTLAPVRDHLLAHGLTILVDDTTAGHFPDHGQQTASMEAIGQACDLAVVVGGDGTLLHAGRALNRHDIPLVGINQGRLGFLADISPDTLTRHLDAILEGRYLTEERMLLHAEVFRDGTHVFGSDAINDVVIHKAEIARMIEFRTEVEGRYVHTHRSDGMIISTPTGSTAYALSGGGPIIHPAVPAILLVPICPHTLSNRPIVIGAGCRIEVEITHGGEDEAQLTCDGQVYRRINRGDRVQVAASPHCLKLLHPEDYDYYEILRAKLGWAGTP